MQGEGAASGNSRALQAGNSRYAIDLFLLKFGRIGSPLATAIECLRDSARLPVVSRKISSYIYAQFWGEIMAPSGGRDALALSAEKAAVRAREAANKLSKYKEADLYIILNQRITDAGREAGLPKFDLPVDVGQFPRSGAIRQLGKRVFARWNQTLYDFVCKGSAEDKDIRDQLMKALSLKDGSGTALIAGVLVTYFGVAAAIAVVIAVLVVKLIIQPAGDEICKAWGEAL
jgi:hypothetical protein